MLEHANMKENVISTYLSSEVVLWVETACVLLHIRRIFQMIASQPRKWTNCVGKKLPRPFLQPSSHAHGVVCISLQHDNILNHSNTWARYDKLCAVCWSKIPQRGIQHHLTLWFCNAHVKWSTTALDFLWYRGQDWDLNMKLTWRCLHNASTGVMRPII